MMTRRLAPIALVAMPLALGACAGTDRGEFPSLAIRDAERAPVSPAPSPGTGAEPAHPSTALADRLADLQERAAAAHRAFLETAPATERLVAAAAGSAVASESWAVAQAALSHLDSRRNPATTALAELDRLYVEAELEAGPAQAVAQARGNVLALVNDEQAKLDSLAGRMPD